MTQINAVNHRPRYTRSKLERSRLATLERFHLSSLLALPTDCAEAQHASRYHHHSVMPILLLTALTALGGLTFVLASLLILANRKLYVVEDLRIETVDNLLPQANCGGCGFPSCRAFAEALVGGLVAPSKCQVSSEEQRASIAAFLNVAVGDDVKKVARLACAGGSNVAENRAHYVGPPTCVAANQVGGGHKACSWGCLGFGDCARVWSKRGQIYFTALACLGIEPPCFFTPQAKQKNHLY